MTNYSHETYISPFTWRYGSSEMRILWSEQHKRRLWRRIWVAMAEVQAEAGLVSQEQVQDLRAHANEIDWARAQEIEHDLRHDLMAEVKTFAEQCPIGGGIIHLGATSMDVEDNADALRLREALEIVAQRLQALLVALAKQMNLEADTVVMAFTHLQPAEPTTLGYRLAQYAQDFIQDRETLRLLMPRIKGKGFKGAVGTASSYTHLLEGTALSAAEMEQRIMARLGLEAFAVTTQTYPRKMDAHILDALASIAQSCYKFALDVRLLQSPAFGELSEPFGTRQVGSSAMPFKRNPITSESVCSLARQVAALARIGWDNAAHSALERTLDDSANRRSTLPEAFLAVDDILSRLLRVVRGLRVNRAGIQRNLDTYGPFAATEPLLMALVRAGASRQEMHECIRESSMQAWDAIQCGQANPLATLLAQNEKIIRHLAPDEVRRIIAQGAGVGDAPRRTRDLAQEILDLCDRGNAWFRDTDKERQKMTLSETEFGPELAEGKTKIIYAHPTRDDIVYMYHKDNLSAGDGARRSVLPGKGAVACRTNSNVFYVLDVEGVPTHYFGMVGDRINIVTPCKMIPLEVVMRRIAFGSYLRRHPEVAEGTCFEPVVVEFFYKDDAQHDPLVDQDQILAMGLANEQELAIMEEIGRQVFSILEREWAREDVTLVDLKIEFGRTEPDGRLVVADVIDNDSWRIWPGGDRNKQLDKQVYRDLPEVTDEHLKEVLANYMAVADLTDRWVIPDKPKGQ